MRLFIDIFNSDLEVFLEEEQAFQIYNIRYILKEYDENYPIAELLPYFNAIMAEHQLLSGQKSSNRHFEKLDIKEWTKYKLKGIDLAVFSLEMGYKQGAIDIIESLKLKVQPNIGALIRLAKSINNRIKLQEGKEREDIQKMKTAEKVIWNDRRVHIQKLLNIMPDYNCSVALYLSYEKQAKTA